MPSSSRRRVPFRGGPGEVDMLEGLTSEFAAVGVALAILLGLLGIFAAMALFAKNYVKVPPSTVAIFFGRKHTFIDEHGNKATVGFRVVRGGAALRVPIL